MTVWKTGKKLSNNSQNISEKYRISEFRIVGEGEEGVIYF